MRIGIQRSKMLTVKCGTKESILLWSIFSVKYIWWYTLKVKIHIWFSWVTNNKIGTRRNIEEYIIWSMITFLWWHLKPYFIRYQKQNISQYFIILFRTKKIFIVYFLEQKVFFLYPCRILALSTVYARDRETRKDDMLEWCVVFRVLCHNNWWWRSKTTIFCSFIASNNNVSLWESIYTLLR